MPWHSHLKPGFPNRLLTDAFLIISVINVSHRAMRLISHMQSWDHLEQGKSTGRKKQKRKKTGTERKCLSIMCDERTIRILTRTPALFTFFMLRVATVHGSLSCALACLRGHLAAE